MDLLERFDHMGEKYGAIISFLVLPFTLILFSQPGVNISQYVVDISYYTYQYTMVQELDLKYSN